jgi:hypothetical protein
MKKIVLSLLVLLGVCAGVPVNAHEFWMLPQSFSPRAGSTEHLQLYVGEYFTGDLTGFSAAHTGALDLYSKSGKQPLVSRLPVKDAWRDFPLPLGPSGTYVAAFDSAPLLITMPPDKFHAYLHDEGLDAIVKLREAAGSAATPGRERFRRNVKTLLTVGGKSDATFGVVTGQRLELLPQNDPARRSINDPLQFTLLFDGQPLENGLVKAWQKQGGQLSMIRVRSDAQGRFVLKLPYAGAWMLSVVHMVAATDTAEADWDSYWGNLTFALRAKNALDSR